MLAPVRTKTCEYCGKQFAPFQSMQRVCATFRCANGFVKQQAKAKADAIKKRKKDAATPRQAKARAQTSFNKFIRARDAALPCVSCGAIDPPMKPGGQWDAGHFLSRGAYPELAFNEDNCHKQCKSCNAGSGKFAHKARTVSQSYEAELINRIGPDRLAALKGPHLPVKKTAAEWDAVDAEYRAKFKHLKEAQ